VSILLTEKDTMLCVFYSNTKWYVCLNLSRWYFMTICVWVFSILSNMLRYDDDVLCVLRYEYESMDWRMFWWVLKYDENEIWFMWFIVSKWFYVMFMNYERDMCWKRDHGKEGKMIL
jgi:hypothetical protein